MSCDSIRNQFFLLLHGELPFDEEELVEQHLAACADCRAELERQRKLGEVLSAQALEVPEDLLARCRRDLRFKTADAAREPQAKIGLVARAREALRFLFGPSTGSFDRTSYWKPVGALALVLVGFFAARITAPRASQPLVPPSSEPVISRVRSIQPGADGRVKIVMDETRQRVLTGRLDEEPVLRTLLAATRDPDDPGLRGESVELLKDHVNSGEVRGALVYALRHDPNAGVRLRAMDALRAYSAEPESRKALMDVLLADDNPGIRTQAVDLLTEQKDTSVVPAFQRSLLREDNSYVRLRLQNALREMNASMETF
jgi:hypothetical protein